MNANNIRKIARAALSGSLPLSEIIENLIAEGVECYHVDYVALQITFYSDAGDIVVTPLSIENLPKVAREFNGPALQAAILDSQQNGQKFQKFSARAVEAGVQGYYAFLCGKRVLYFGRQGDQHVEWFPTKDLNTHINSFNVRQSATPPTQTFDKEATSMENFMKPRNIIISSVDYARLRDLLITAKQFGSTQSALLDTLEGELNRAKIVPPEEIPPYVVTMNTCVRLIDTATGEEMRYTLVFPNDANQQGKLSILSDLGVAIIGFSVGNTVEWAFPEGTRCIRIDMIYFQPEAIKRYDL